MVRITKLIEKWQQLLEFHNALTAIIIYYLFIASIYALMSVVNYQHYQTQEDLAVFTQGIWQYSRFQFPYITFHHDRYFLGNHFHPILILLAPVFWIWPSATTLLVLQPFITLSAIIPLFLISYKLTKSSWLSGSLIFAFSFYIPLQYAIFFDFHAFTLCPPFIACAYLSYLHDSRKYFNISLGLLLLLKEEFGILAATFGIFLLLNKRWRKLGLAWIITGISSTLFLTKVFIPYLGGDYMFAAFGPNGETPTQLLFYHLTHPSTIPDIFFDHPTKRETLHWSYWPYAYLPLLSPFALITASGQFLIRFMDQVTISRWKYAYHYSAPIAVIMPIGTAVAAGYISKLSKPRYRKTILVTIGIILLVCTRLEQINKSAILLIKREQFWNTPHWAESINQALPHIPANASLATQNNIAAHVATRRTLVSLEEIDKVDYVLVNFDPGQLDYYFFGKKAQIQSDIQTRLKQGKLQIVYQQDQTTLYQTVPSADNHKHP